MNGLFLMVGTIVLVIILALIITWLAFRVENRKRPLVHKEDLTDPPEPDESNLVKHARRELELIGEDPETIYGYLRVIREFAKMGHSGGSASVMISVLPVLLNYKALSPLTDEPGEWLYHGEDVWGDTGGIWQNCRDSEAFSNDGGKTYYLLSEREWDDEAGGYRTTKYHESVPRASLNKA